MISLDYPPSANVYWRKGKGGKIYVSEEAQAYKDAVGYQLKAAGVEPVSGNLSVTMHVYRKIRKGDVDNRIKVTLDAMQGFAYQNDDQVVELHVYRHDDPTNPRVEVEIVPKPAAFTFSVWQGDNRELFVDCQPVDAARKIQGKLSQVKGVDHVVSCRDWLAVVPKARVKLDKLQDRLMAELERLVVA